MRSTVVLLLALAGAGCGATATAAPEPTAREPAARPAEAAPAEPVDEAAAARAALEAFLERYPDDPERTPDALFRLAALEVDAERAANNAATEEWERGGRSGSPPTTEHERSSGRLRDLVERFPTHRLVPDALYHLGMNERDLARIEPARDWWLRAACPNALPLPPGADPYAVCMPLEMRATLAGELFLQIGETHFDDVGPGALDLACSAYARALVDPSSPTYGIALYKLGWAQYRADRFAEALARFLAVIAHVDGGGAAETVVALRPEAVMYAAMVLSSEDWTARGISRRAPVRARDAHLLPRDAPGASEIATALGQVLFDDTRYADAVEVWLYVRDTWPDRFASDHLEERITSALARTPPRRPTSGGGVVTPMPGHPPPPP